MTRPSDYHAEALICILCVCVAGGGGGSEIIHLNDHEVYCGGRYLE